MKRVVILEVACDINHLNLGRIRNKWTDRKMDIDDMGSYYIKHIHVEIS